MTATQELLDNNQAYAAAFDQGHLSMPPAKQVAVWLHFHCREMGPTMGVVN